MIIKKIVVGPLQTNCYLVADGKIKEAVIIDPGDEAEKIFKAIEENNLKPKFIILTHGHPDHTAALKEIKEMSKAELLTAGDGDEFQIGSLKIKTMAAPGHTPDSVCFVVKDPAEGGAGIIFSGDTLFKGGIGRTDLKGGDWEQVQKSLKRLMEFPDNFKVFPGHGPETTIGEERKSNPFLTF